MSMQPQPRPLPADQPRSLAADRLYGVATVLLAALPVVMVVANRSSPLILTLAAIAAAAALMVERRLPAHARRAWKTPLAIAAAAFLAWALLSVAWSPFRMLSLHALGEFVLPVAATLVLALALPRRVPLKGAGILAGGAAGVACILLILDMASGQALRHLLGMRAVAFVQNRPALTLLVVAPALLVLLGASGRRWMAATLAALVAAAILRSESGAAKLGLLCGCAAFLLACLSRRGTFILVGAMLLAAFAVAPSVGDLAERLLPAQTYDRLARAHARDRVDLWRSFGAALREAPWKGTGIGTSARMAEVDAASRVEPEFRPLLAIGHPHNVPLQVWVELGAIGAFLATAVAGLAWVRLATLPDPFAAPLIALIAAALAASMVGQGAWQGWWPAALGTAATWFTIAWRERVPDA
jgi:O-antigen ligase